MASNGYQRSTGRLGRAFGAPDEAQDPYAINTPMAQVDPRSNPYGQGGGLRGRLRDALLAGGSAGHNRNRMAPVMNARMWDRGMAPEQQNYMAQQRAQQEYQQQQQDRVDGKKNKVSAYTDYLKNTMARGETGQLSMRSWLSLNDAGRNKLLGADASGSSNVQSRFTGANGNVHIIRRDGSVEDTGVKGSPAKNEFVDVGGVSYIRQTDPGGKVTQIPLDEWQRNYRTQSLGAETYASDRGADWAEKDKVFEDFVMTGAPLLQSRVTDLRDIKAKLDDGSLATGIQRGGPLAALFDPDAGEASVVSMLETLKAVSEYGLTPVSDNDVDNIKAMFVDFWATGEVNSVKLGQAIEKMEAVIRDTELKARYFYDDDNKTLKGYNNKNRPRFDIGDGYTGASTNSRAPGSTNEVTVVRTRKAD